MKIIKYVKNYGNYKAQYVFHPMGKSDEVPGPVDAALTIAMVGDSYIVVKKADNNWDILGGKVNKGEGILETVKRESYEEAGVEINIDTAILIGYIEAKNLGNFKNENFHEHNFMPVYISFVENIDRAWVPIEGEILERKLLSYKKLIKLLEDRNDNGQLKEIVAYSRELFQNKQPRWTFNFINRTELNEKGAPVTQVMAFCKDKKNEYCIVRDGDEDFYSLPGGGCELDELPEDGIKREVMEEAQVQIENLRILGTVIVDMEIDGRLVSKSQHLRYLCYLDEDKIDEFVPEKNGHETVERKFVEKNQLANLVKLLNNPTGKEIIKFL